VLSEDGTTWDDVSIRNVPSLQTVTYALGIFVLLGDAGQVYTSPNGTQFFSGSTGVSETFQAVAFHQDRFVTVGANGNFRQSFDAVSWFGGAF